MTTLSLALAACSGEGVRGDQGASVDATSTSTPPPATASSEAIASRAVAGTVILPATGDAPAAPSPPRVQARPSATGADTARGTVAVVGADPLTQVVLRQPGAVALGLAGSHAQALRTLAGVELWVRGNPVEGMRPTIEVREFAVRAVNGLPAIDGVLASQGEALVLVDATGMRHTLRHPPRALRELIGARVWIAGAEPGEVVSYGVIRGN